MKTTIEDHLSFSKKIDFGSVTLMDSQVQFCRQLNLGVFSLLKSLPNSLRKDAALFMTEYAGISFDNEINFFKNFYAPSWSILYWLIHFDDAAQLPGDEIFNSITAHSMALMLHSLDDHLNDGDILTTHLSLLLRSQAWSIMNRCLGRLAGTISKGDELIEHHINTYYSAVCCSNPADSFNEYCRQFGDQMGTWLIVPILMAKRTSDHADFIDTIQSTYQSFGTAWRLLDDINDISEDMNRGIRSSVYFCLPEKIRAYWDKNDNDTFSLKREKHRIIAEYILKNGIIDIILLRIEKELTGAAALAEAHFLPGLAEELRCLSRPLNRHLDMS